MIGIIVIIYRRLLLLNHKSFPVTSMAKCITLHTHHNLYLNIVYLKQHYLMLFLNFTDRLQVEMDLAVISGNVMQPHGIPIINS